MGGKKNPNNTATHKECPQCNRILPHSDYHISKLQNLGISTYCKACSVNRDAKTYQKQKDSHRLKRLDLKRKYVDLLGGKCSRCGYNEFLAGLDFHHTSDKAFDVAKLIARSSRGTDYQLDKLANEVTKCILLCRNCHSAYHAKQWS